MFSGDINYFLYFVVEIAPIMTFIEKKKTWLFEKYILSELL